MTWCFSRGSVPLTVFENLLKGSSDQHAIHILSSSGSCTRQGSISWRLVCLSTIDRIHTNVCPYYFTLSDGKSNFSAQKTAGGNHIRVQTGCQVSTGLLMYNFHLSQRTGVQRLKTPIPWRNLDQKTSVICARSPNSESESPRTPVVFGSLEPTPPIRASMLVLSSRVKTASSVNLAACDSGTK